MYQFKSLSLGEIDHEQFLSYSEKSIFTTPAWIQFVADDSNATPHVIQIDHGGRVLGYFSGLIVSKFGVKIFGSPFRGWSTCFMGFDVADEGHILQIIPAIIPYIYKTTRVKYIEIVDRSLQVADADSIPYTTSIVDTLELSVDAKSDDDLLSGFKSDCRNFINQFGKRGATLEEATPDDAFAVEYYDQLTDVFAKQGMVPTYSLEKVKTLLRNFSASDNMLCLRVRNPKGESIATSIFLGFNKKFFFWGGASYRGSQFYRPNESMIWYAIRYWRARGFKVFDMVGVRDYKLKFGSEVKKYLSIKDARPRILLHFRNWAEKAYFMILRFKGKNDLQEKVKFGNITIEKTIDQEIAHFCDDKIKIFSKFNRVTIEQKGSETRQISLPVSISQRILGLHRLSRRLFRLDKSSIIPTSSGYVAFWQGNVFHLSHEDDKPNHTLSLVGCRNPLHNSVANIDGNILYVGEYGQPHEAGKSIYRSLDGGLSWEKIYNIPQSKIRHIHACKWDPFEEKIWVFTGDFEGQSWVLCADKDFKDVEWIGDGSQQYRAVDAIFDKVAVHWVMDSPLSEVHHIRLDRKTRSIRIGKVFNGPVWYLKKLMDGVTLAGSVQEVGPSHVDTKVHIYATRNMKKWVDIAQFDHDGFKKGIMKFGVAAFADGEQDSTSFYIHFEAVSGFDGKVVQCSLSGI
ncbi:MAG: GNAT family N-acetyltransferase [Candidatus Marinimicrobia bacterium]|nr:GNAT family N-acetyltransferase [Candidatus Neomarinimicrobiota bacterium]